MVFTLFQHFELADVGESGLTRAFQLVSLKEFREFIISSMKGILQINKKYLGQKRLQ